jgi:hypothetical protein
VDGIISHGRVDKLSNSSGILGAQSMIVLYFISRLSLQFVETELLEELSDRIPSHKVLNQNLL